MQILTNYLINYDDKHFETHISSSRSNENSMKIYRTRLIVPGMVAYPNELSRSCDFLQIS